MMSLGNNYVNICFGQLKVKAFLRPFSEKESLPYHNLLLGSRELKHYYLLSPGGLPSLHAMNEEGAAGSHTVHVPASTLPGEQHAANTVTHIERATVIAVISCI